MLLPLQFNRFDQTEPPPKQDLFILGIISVIAVLCFLPGLNAYGMLDPTDSFFYEAAREMLECRHYVTVIFNYIDWFEKPGFPFWLTILSYKIFGINDFAGRLPAALSGLILVLETYIFSAPFLGRRAALLSALVLASSPLFLIVGHVALSDEVLSMLFATSMFFIGSSLVKQQGKVHPIAYVFLALAVLCKGPISLILTAGSLLIFMLFVCRSSNDAWRYLLRLRPAAAVLIILAITVPYYILAHVTTSGAFTEQFFLRQNLGRLQGKVNHLEPAWFYVPVFFGGYFPWSVYFLYACRWLSKFFKRRLALNLRQKFIAFCFCWFLFVALLFTLVPTRLPTYIVPFSPALAIVIGSYMELFYRAFRQKVVDGQSKRVSKILLGLPMFVATIASLVFLSIAIIKGPPRPVLFFLVIGLIGVLLFTILANLALWRSNYQLLLRCIFIATLLGAIFLVPASFCWFYQTHQIVFNEMIEIVKDKKGSLATLFSPVPTVIFRLGKPVKNIESLSDLALYVKNDKGPHFLIASKNCLQLTELKAREHVVYTDGKWYLLGVDGFPW